MKKVMIQREIKRLSLLLSKFTTTKQKRRAFNIEIARLKKAYDKKGSWGCVNLTVNSIGVIVKAWE